MKKKTKKIRRDVSTKKAAPRETKIREIKDAILESVVGGVAVHASGCCAY